MSESKDREHIKSFSEPRFISSNPQKNSSPSIMSAPTDKKKISLLIGAIAGCAVSTTLAIIFLFLFISTNAKVSQLERDVTDYKKTILDLKNQINELDK